MSTADLLASKVVKFYGNPVLHKHKRLIEEDYQSAFNAGRAAYTAGCGSNENPYTKGEGNAIWTRYDCWLEGYLSLSRSIING